MTPRMGRVWVRTQADAFDKTLHLTDGGGGGDTTVKGGQEVVVGSPRRSRWGKGRQPDQGLTVSVLYCGRLV